MPRDRLPSLLLLIFSLLLTMSLGSSDLEGRFNYASFDCAARILATNPGAKSSTSILSSQRDSYLRNLCSFPSKWIVVELCQDVRIDTIVLANHEFFSSTFREVEVWLAKRYPMGGEEEWCRLGSWVAQDMRGEQVFKVVQDPDGGIYGRFLKIVLKSHYGREYYCPVSVLKVFGRTMMDDFAEEEDRKRREKSQKISNISNQADEGVLVVVAEDKEKKRVESPVRTFCPYVAEQSSRLLFNSTCCAIRPSRRAASSSHSLQLFKARPSLQPIIPLRNRLRPLFPIPLKPIRKTIIYQLICFVRNPLKHPRCPSLYKTMTVLQREYMDPDRIVLSDLNFASHGDRADETKSSGKKNENIFKSLNDRLDALEQSYTKQALLLHSAIHRFEHQLDQIGAELDLGDEAARGLEAYRVRLQRYLVGWLDERMERLEERVDSEFTAGRNEAETLKLGLAALVLMNLMTLLVLCISWYKSRKPSNAAFTFAQVHSPSQQHSVSPILHSADQSVPKRGDSLERVVENSLMEASPLLLFDPETHLVDAIFSASPRSPRDSEDVLVLPSVTSSGKEAADDGVGSMQSSASDLAVPLNL